MSNTEKKAKRAKKPVRIHDSYDVQPGDSKLSQAYIDAVTPEHVKRRIAEVQAARAKS